MIFFLVRQYKQMQLLKGCMGCRYNLVVIGAGAGGLVTSAGAAGVGAKVAIIEEHLMGGDCLNVGCVPSKAVIRCARAVYEVIDYSRNACRQLECCVMQLSLVLDAKTKLPPLWRLIL